MTDIARVGFSAETGALTDAKAKLEALIPAAKGAESAVDSFNREAESTGSAVRAAAAGLPGLTSAAARAASGFNGIDGALAGAASGMTLTSRAALMAGSALDGAGSKTNSARLALNSLNGTLSALRPQLDEHVQLWRLYQAELAELPGKANNAKSALDRLGSTANDNINRLQATPGNIAAQFQDIGVSAAGGLNPMLIALQQGTQLGAAMTGGLGNLKAAFMQVLSPVNLLTIGVVGLVAALIQAGIASLSAADGADELRKATDDLIDSINEEHAATVRSIQSSYASIKADIAEANSKRILANETRQATIAKLEFARASLKEIEGGTFTAGTEDMASAMLGLGVTAKVVTGQIAEYDQQIEKLNNSIAKSDETIRLQTGQLVGLELAASLDATTGATFKFDKAMDGLNGRLQRGEISLTEYAKASWSLNRTLLDEKEAIKDSERAHRQRSKTMTDGQREAQRLAREAERDLKQRIKSSEDFAEQLLVEAKNIGLTAVEIKRLEVNAKAAAAPLATLATEIFNAGKAWEEAYAGNARKEQQEALDQLAEEIQLTNDLAALRLDATKSLTGRELKNALKEIDIYGEKQRNNAKATAEYNEYMRLSILASSDKARDLWIELAEGAMQSAELRNNALDTAHGLAMATDEAARLNAQLGRAAASFDRMTGTNMSGLLEALDKGFRGEDGKNPFFDGLAEAFNGLKEGADNILKGLGSSLKQVGAGIAIGTTADGIMDALGIKSSKTGAQIGGAIGQFGSPLVAIAGSILGGIVGGMLKSTPRASATVSIIAGEAMESQIKGSSGKLKAIAGQLADGVIGGLEQIAAELGAQLTGDAKVSIGVRKGKYRVDPTGSGITKTSKGAVDFGEDKAGAITYALQIAIQQGVIGGLSDSLRNLITGDGDLQSQLTKALSFKSVFDELAQNDDPAKWAQDEITRWHDAMRTIFDEAGATADELAELERLTGIKRADAAKEAAEKIEQANRAALQLERDRQGLLARIADLEGRSLEALVITHQLELQTVDESLRPLYERIYALEDVKKAEEEAAAATAEAARLASEMAALAKQNAIDDFTLQQRLAAAYNDDATVLKLQREAELREATSDMVRAQLLAIYAAEDLTTALNEQAEAAQRIADERYGLETQILQLQENTLALRQRELATIDPSNRALQELIYSLEDARDAARAAAEAQEELARQQQAIAQERYGLETRYLNLIGNTAELRKRELAALLSDENRAYLQMIFDTEDALAATEAAAKAAKDAQDAYASALNDARNILIEAYNRERGELVATADKYRGLIDTMRTFREGLSGILNPLERFNETSSRYQTTLRGARMGDERAISNYTGAAKDYIDAARARSSNSADFNRIIGQVKADAKSLEMGFVAQVNYAQMQISKMDEQLNALIQIDESVISFADAMKNYEEVQRAFIPSVTTAIDQSNAELIETLETTSNQQKEVAENTKTAIEMCAVILGRMDARFADVIVEDTMQVSGVSDKPVYTEATP